MPQINMKEAVEVAKHSLADLFSDDTLNGVALEELELVSDAGKEMWAVTLGFHRQKAVSALEPSGGIASLIALQRQKPVQVEHRVFKTVYVNANSGEFVKMDMRLVQ
jgi:hypothetical protein